MEHPRRVYIKTLLRASERETLQIFCGTSLAFVNLYLSGSKALHHREEDAQARRQKGFKGVCLNPPFGPKMILYTA